MREMSSAFVYTYGVLRVERVNLGKDAPATRILSTTYFVDFYEQELTSAPFLVFQLWIGQIRKKRNFEKVETVVQTIVNDTKESTMALTNVISAVQLLFMHRQHRHHSFSYCSTLFHCEW